MLDKMESKDEGVFRASSGSLGLSSASTTPLEDHKSKSWFVRHRRAGDAVFLVKMYLYTFWIIILPMVPVVIVMNLDKSFVVYDEVAYGCNYYTPALTLFAVGVIASIIFMVFIAVLLRKSQDAFHIRHEILAICVMWAIMFPPMLAYSLLPSSETTKYFPPSFIITIALMFSFIFTVSFPLYLARKDEQNRKIQASVNKYDEFQSKLALPAFRNAFYQFLSLQFCGENLLFYEVAGNWKAKVENKAYDEKERADQAIAIHDSFVIENSEYQINIHSDMRDKISLKVNNKEFLDDLFNEAIKEVTEMMYSNSYHLFLKSKLFEKSTFIIRESDV